MDIIKLKNINKKYIRKDEQIEALKNISLTFENGKFYAIMGHSGSGKSTLIRIIGLMDNCDSGIYTLNKIDVKKLNDIEKSNNRMKEIGFIFQDFYLDKNMSALDNVILPMLINKNIKKDERKQKATNLLKKVGLLERANHFPKELSGGEQQRVCIARALANDPNIILADEPTGNLDEKNEQIIFEQLKELSKEGKCIIVVSHSNEVKKYADEIINLKSGEII